MTHLFLAILLKKGFDFTDYTILIVPVVLIASIIISYKAPWDTPFKAVISMALIIICLTAIIFLYSQIGYLASAGVLVGFLGKVMFKKSPPVTQ